MRLPGNLWRGTHLLRTRAGNSRIHVGVTMATIEVLNGVLRPDGTLELNDVPHVPAGPVEVMLRACSAPAATNEDWWQYLQRVRAEAEAAGGPFRTQAEIDADRASFREQNEPISAVSSRGSGAGTAENCEA